MSELYSAKPDDRIASTHRLCREMILGLLDTDEPTPAERMTLERIEDELKYGPTWAVFAGSSKLPLVGSKSMCEAAARALNFARVCDRTGELRRLVAELGDGLTGDVLRDIEEAAGVEPGPDDDDDDGGDFDSDLDDDDPERTQLYAPEQIPMVTVEPACSDADPAYQVIVHGRT